MLLGSQFCLLKFMSIKTASSKPGTLFFARDLVSGRGGFLHEEKVFLDSSP
jgi:hypothetical protein